MALAARPKRPPQHKKRIGQHHRQSKVYLKSYWPYLPMLLIVGVGLAINTAWSTQSVLGSHSDFTSSALLESTNHQRLEAQESTLSLDPQLNAAAQAKAEDMAAKNYWAHNSPDGRTPWSFISAAGYNYQLAGENLAFGFSNASDTVSGWMNSPEHRANILNKDYQNVGFGVVSTPNFQGKGPETIVVAEYASPSAAAANITFNVDDHAAEVKNASTELSARPVSRIQVLTGGQASWSLLALSAITGAALAVFIVRHGFRVRRLISQGESFVAHHPYLDIAIVFIVMAGYILTRTNGLIR
jgi:methylmalonyl-CoA mutase cobalamin-binding subunit